MAISFVATATNESDTGTTSLAVTKPAAVANGDVLIGLASIGGSQSFSGSGGGGGPTGWTQIGTTVSTSGVTTAAWFKVAASEPSTWTWNYNASTASVIDVSVYRGVSGTPIDVSAQSTTTTTKTVTGPSATTTATNCWMLYTRTSRATSGVKADVATTVVTGGLSKRVDAQFSVTSTVCHGVAIIDGNAPVASGSQTGAQTSTTTSSPTDGIHRTIGLAPDTLNSSADVVLSTSAAYDATVQTGVAAAAALVTSTSAAYDIVRGTETALSTSAALDATAALSGSADVATATTNVGDKGIHYGAPPGRTLVVGGEARTYAPDPESRSYVVPIVGVD